MSADLFAPVFVCHSGRLFSTKLSELHDSVKIDCTPIIACFDVGSESRQNQSFRSKPRFSPSTDSPLPSPTALRREYTFSSESDESYGIQLLSRIASDLQVEEDSKLIIPVAIVRPKRKDSYDMNLEQVGAVGIARSPYGSETRPVRVVDTSDAIDPQVMLSCLDAGALDVVKSPLDKAGIMGLTVHAYRRHKMAKKEQASFMAAARRARKQSWVGVEEKEQPYAYLREAMVRKLLRGICEPETTIESYQQRDLCVADDRKLIVARAVGTWNFDGSLFDEEELVYAGYCILDHALQLPELENWRMSEGKFIKWWRMRTRLTLFRPITTFHARLSSSLQSLRIIPQFSACRRCVAVTVLLSSTDRHPASIPGGGRVAALIHAEITNCKASGFF